MGLWHDRQLNNEFIENKHYPVCSSLKKIDNASLGILAASYHCVSLYTHTTDTTQIFLAIDGTVDNLVALSSNLGLSSAHVSDVIFALYLHKGPKGLYLIEGAASIILFDVKKKQTILHRLFLKGHPLYFFLKNERLSACTNPIHLLHRSDASGILNKTEVTRLFAINPLYWKIKYFSEIEVVSHGELVIVSPTGIEREKRQLDKIFYKTRSVLSDKETICQYRALLESAVRECIQPGKKYGIMLSSGMDSSSIAVYAAKTLQAEGRELVAYSWTLPNDSADESDKIKKICAHLNIPLKLFNADHLGPFDNIDSPFLLSDTPFVNAFWSLNQECYRLAAADGIDFLFNGNFADLLFVGREKQLANAWHDRRFDRLIPIIISAIKKQGINLLTHSSIKYFFAQKTREDTSPKLWLTEEANNILEKEKEVLPRNGFKYFQFALCPFHAGYLGEENDLCGLYGLQRIEPHRNLALINFTLTTPSYLTYRNGQSKYFVREAMRDLLPEEVIKQPRVGLLSDFAIKSFIRNRQKVRKKIFESQAVWSRYIRKDWVLNKLQDNIEVDSFDVYIIRLCINLVEWQKAIKPGGSLYEGSAPPSVP